MRDWAVALLGVLVVLQHTSTPTTAKQACVVSSDPVIVPWEWPEVLVTVWVPPPQDTADYILKFDIHFAGENPQNATAVALRLLGDKAILSYGGNGSNSSLESYVDLQQKWGWLNVTLELKGSYLLTRTSTNEVLFSSQVGLQYADVQEVVITGSNITVNCAQDQLLWSVARDKEVVPLTPGGSGWKLGVYPTSIVQPTITLRDANFTLGLNDRILSANSTYPLLPFIYSWFEINCLPSSALRPTPRPTANPQITCYVKSKSLILKEVDLDSYPTFLVVESESGEPFYLIQETVPLPLYVPKEYDGPPKNKSAALTTPRSVTGSGGSNVHGTRIGWSGWWAALAVVLACLLIFVIIMCFVSHYHRPKIEKLDPIWYTRKLSKRYLENMNLIAESPSQEHLETSPLPECRPLLARSCSVVVDVEDPKTTAPLRLWNAVASGELEEVEQVLATMTPDPEIMLEGWDTSPYEEAHRRGYCHILKMLDTFMSKQPKLPDNDLIISVMQSHARNVEAVFEAARGGQYRHGGGVDVLLRSYSLPGTVHDQHGQSLLHYAASVKLADGGPLWLAPDIRSLVETHHVFVNAVDYKGQTALHSLAEKASMSEQNTCWDGKAVSVKQAWVNLAILIMRLGCDPRLPDNANMCPDEVATENLNAPLAEEMVQERENLGQINYSKCLARFKEFLEASRQGHVDQMLDLLKEGVNVLPLGSRSDPLEEAIRGGHRDAVFLLLSAGAPLCAHGLVGDTPYEAAHSTPGLPALFPALIRRALCGRLETEINLIRNSSRIPDNMKKGSKDIKVIIESSGHKLAKELSKWMAERPVDSLNSFNKMLSTSASLGLTLICQLMGVAGVRLNPLPNEQQPLLLALNNNQHNTVYALCRDLKMNPYSVGVTNDDISKQLVNDLLQSELMIFEKKLRKAGLDEVTVENLLNYSNGISDRECATNPTKVFLYLLAELSLVSLLHKVRKISNDSLIDTVVHEASGSTMMHIAAAYGRINMVEYLLSEGADHTCKASGGLTASHLAAARGHKDCMQYILDYTRQKKKCSLGTLPQQIMSDFEENIKSFHLDLLSVVELDAISKAKDGYSKTKLILSSRCEKIGITSEKSLWDIVVKEQKLVKDLVSDDFVTAVESEVCDFLQEVMRIDSRFKSTIVMRSPVVEKTEIFLPETFEIFCELEDYHSLKDGCISLGKNAKREAEFIDTLKTTKDQELFNGSNFRYSFYKAALEALKNFTFKTLALVPPFLTHSSTGVSIFSIFRKKSRINLVQILISPVLKVPCPTDLSLRRRYQKQVQFPPYEHLASNSDNIWVYLLNNTYKLVLPVITEEERMVLLVCLYFSKLLSTCWWLPRRQHKRVGCTWQTYPIGVDFPSSNTLISAFFEELMDSKEGTLKRENFVEKAISVLKRTSPLGKRKVSFLTASNINPPEDSISAVIHFLENISVKRSQESLYNEQNVTKTFGKYGNANKAISKSSLNVEIE